MSAASPAPGPAHRSLPSFTASHRRLRPPVPLSPAVAAVALAAWFTASANVALWQRLASMPEVQPGLLAGIALVVFAAHAALVGAVLLVAPLRVARHAWIALALIAAIAQHYTWRFGVVVDPQLIASAWQTDRREAFDVLGARLLFDIAWVAGPPAWWLLRGRFAMPSWSRRLGQALVVVLLGVAVTASLAAGLYRSLAPLVRNHMELRFLPNPVMPVVSLVRLVRKATLREAAPVPITIGAGARLGPSYAAASSRPPLLVLVVGETARADHFGLNGYPRDTTPELAARGVVSHTRVRSCGTHTLASVPCMFSPLGAAAFDRHAASNGNLLDVVQAAGLAVLWVDNQSGCKGVCERVPTASTGDLAGSEAAARLCRDGECLDEALGVGLERRIAALPEPARQRGVLVVLHQMGSHGPAYGRRSPPAQKRFLPECTTLALDACDPRALVNAYDNSIAYTDHVLAGLIDQLARSADRFAPALVYVSDHGESLGENGVFLHGLPLALAPQAQTHVPLVTWFDRGFLERDALDARCIAAGKDRPASHDNLFHSVLGLLDIRSPSYRADRDLWAACRPPRSPQETM